MEAKPDPSWAYAASMPTEAPKPLEITLWKPRNRLSRIDILPPCRALASTGSTMVAGRLMTQSQVARPRIKPPSGRIRILDSGRV